MRKISINLIKEGMELAKAIYTSDGNVLLSAGMKLKVSYIKRLKELNINYIYIEDKISQDIVIKDIISDELKFEARVAVRKVMDNIKLGDKLSTKSIRNCVTNIVDELMSKPSLLVNMEDIRSVDDYLFYHSINVSVLSIITGISLGYTKDKLKDLGMGAMLHDIGKVKLPLEILNKPSDLTLEEYEIVKKHTNIGYEMLKESDDISVYSRYIALTHHEKFDGSGYPLGLKSKEIHEFSKIVSIADVYDAMTSDRVYKKRMKISEVVEYLIGYGNHHFDYEYVRRFIEHITLYPIGSCILLNTKQKAIVVDINNKFPNRPVIRIITDEKGNKLSSFYEIDLTKNNSILIADTIEDI